MIEEDKAIVMDIDGTLCELRKEHQNYLDLNPIPEVLGKLREYREQGFYIILNSARQMRTYKGNTGKINANTAKTLFDWLEKHDIPYDEIHLGKPWCGKYGFYVDDSTVRPDEFANLPYEEILKLIGKS